MKAGDQRTEKDLREEFFDGPLSDTMTFPEFLIKQGRGDLVNKKDEPIDERKKGKTKVKRPEKGKKSPLSTAQSIGNLFSFSPQKHIMELKTNKPRLMKGANLMNPKKADLDKDGKLSSYEKARGKAIEKNIRGK